MRLTRPTQRPRIEPTLAAPAPDRSSLSAIVEALAAEDRVNPIFVRGTIGTLRAVVNGSVR